MLQYRSIKTTHHNLIIIVSKMGDDKLKIKVTSWSKFD